MTCICPSRETPTFEFSKKMEISVQNFIGLLGISNVVKTPLKTIKNLKIFDTATPLKIVIIRISVQKIQYFPKTSLLISFSIY